MKLKSDILRSAIVDVPIEPTEVFVNDKELSQLINISVDSLRHMRQERKGPSYYKVGTNVRYKLQDVKNFLDKCKIKNE